jgi:hypothetical protein
MKGSTRVRRALPLIVRSHVLTPASRPAPQAQANGIIIDLSHGTAEVLGFVQQGHTRVRVEVLKWGSR